jgi:hypothetical protein
MLFFLAPIEEAGEGAEAGAGGGGLDCQGADDAPHVGRGDASHRAVFGLQRGHPGIHLRQFFGDMTGRG